MVVVSVNVLAQEPVISRGHLTPQAGVGGPPERSGAVVVDGPVQREPTAVILEAPHRLVDEGG